MVSTVSLRDVFLPGLFALKELIVASIPYYPEDEDFWCQPGGHFLCHSALGLEQLHSRRRAHGYPPLYFQHNMTEVPGPWFTVG